MFITYYVYRHIYFCLHFVFILSVANMWMKLNKCNIKDAWKYMGSDL